MNNNSKPCSACVFTQTFECKLPANSSVCWHTTCTADENSECQLQCLQGHILLHYTKNNSCSVLTTIKQYTTKKSLPEKHEYSHTDENNANNSLQLAAVHCTQCIIDWLTQHYTRSTKQAQWWFHTAWCLSAFLFIFTARCTLVQSAVLPSHVVCLSVCL